MEGGTGAAFAKGRSYTRAQIRAELGGSARVFLPTRGGKVVCACLTRERNPQAPREVVMGGGERVSRRARALAGSGETLPLFVRVRPGAWEYLGRWRATGVRETPAPPVAGGAAGEPAESSVVLLMEEAVAAAGPCPAPAAEREG